MAVGAQLADVHAFGQIASRSGLLQRRDQPLLLKPFIAFSLKISQISENRWKSVEISGKQWTPMNV